MDPGIENLAKSLATDLGRHYEELVSLFWQQLSVFVLRRTRHFQDTEDIIQETFMRAYLALERYPSERIETLKIRPWLYKIAWSVYCNHTGRGKLPLMIPLEAPDDGPYLEPEEDARMQPEALFEQAEQRRELEALIEKLSPHYRDMVSLYYFEDLSQKEIAEILNLPLGTVKVYIHRGIRQLRKLLEDQGNHKVG
ncbi:MAG TPA: RNA polymerase sigma factor [Ktedonobacteraceae bacterium]